MSYKEVGSWPLVKKYLACHYFLAEEKPGRITEAQRDQLGALHLYVTHGPYQEAMHLAEFSQCSVAEKRRRIGEWQLLNLTNKQAAMQQFVTAVTTLFPAWPRYKKLHQEFETEWTQASPQLRLSPQRVVLPPRPHRLHRSHRPALADRVSRFRSQPCELPALHASRDARELVYALQQRKGWRKRESQYYHQLPEQKTVRDCL